MRRERTIGELEEELKMLKEKEKAYIKLGLKVKDLEERQRRVRRASEDISLDESTQAEKLKSQLEKTLGDIKKVQEDTKTIKEQNRSLQHQYRALLEVFNGLSGENTARRQRIQLKDEKLVDKQNELQSLAEKRHCNELIVEQLRVEIARLQGEEQQLRDQLERLNMTRKSEEMQKQRLRAVTGRVKQQLLDQQNKQQHHRDRLTEAKEAVSVIKEEMVALLQLEDKLKKELNKVMNEYSSVVTVEVESQNRLRVLEDELKLAEEDIRTLTDEYIREGEELQREEMINNRLNTELDQMAKEVLEVWSSLKELMEVSPLKNEQLKHKANQLWLEISQILDLN